MNVDRASFLPPGFRRHFLITLLLGAVIAGCYHFVDRPAAAWARGLGSHQEIMVAFKRVTVFGSSAPYLIGLTLLYPLLRFYLRRKEAAQRALFVFSAIVISGLTVNLIKGVVARWRPIALFTEPSRYGFDFFKIGYEHNSFPSGHATTAGALAGALTLLCPRLRVLWFSAAALVAASRVVVGAHYPGDVVAGFWLGIVAALGLARTSWFRDVRETPASAPRNQGNPTSGDLAQAAWH